jgi:hypothetical protein
MRFKGEFRLTKRGAELARALARLFAELVPYFVLKIDHASHARFEKRPFGKWDVWMNVINVEADLGTSERTLFSAFYGKEHDWDNAGWREMAAFSLLRPASAGIAWVAGSDPRRVRGNAHQPRLKDPALAQRIEVGHR